MSRLSTTDVAVIGVGYSATALVVDLVDRLPPSRSITMVGPTGDLGRGVAYGTTDRAHLLNVPAGRMSATAAHPDHFVDWLRDRGTGYGPADYVPRALYGDYVRDSFASALRRTGNRAAIRHVDATADGFAATDEGGYPFRLSNGDVLLAETAVLCIGASAAPLPVPAAAVDPAAGHRIVERPWEGDWTGRVGQDDAVLLVGSGLTMVDLVLTLARNGHRGPIHAVSRHGLLPQPHRVPRAAPVDVDVAPGRTGLADALNTLRAAVDSEADWRSVVDGLRPVTQALWAGMSLDQRARFLRHALSFWSIHRHRMAPEIHVEIEALRAAGRLTLHAGRVSRIDATGDRAAVLVRPRGGGPASTLTADHVVNCCGAERCPSLARSPLLADLAERGLVSADPLGLGIRVDDDSTVIGPDGTRRPGLHAIGPATTGRFWEITAVPDIRVQVADVAAGIARRLMH